MVQRVDEYAKMYGVSRSALCALWIGQTVASLDRVADSYSKMNDKLDPEKLLQDPKMIEFMKSIFGEK